MSKALLYAAQTREGGTLHDELLEGVAQIALAVGSTLGPRGCNVIIDRAGDTPLVTKDGVTVARNIQLTNPVHQASVKMIQAVARATVDEAGDGTTTATVLAHNLLRAGLKLVAEGASPIALQRAIGAAVELISLRIRSIAVEPTDEQIAHVATIATNGNSKFGAMILDAVLKVGRQGIINLDDSSTPESWLEIRDGFQFASGFTWPDFITDRRANTAILHNPYILITERQLSQGIASKATLHDLGPLFTFCAGLDLTGKVRIREPRPLLIVADDVLPGSDAAQTILLNHHKELLQICVVRAPAFGELRRGALADMALVTGGRVLTADGGNVLSKWVLNKAGEFTDENLGKCTRVVVSNSRTVIESGHADPTDENHVEKYAASLLQQASESPDPGTREHLRQRAARLTGSVAVLHVGTETETESRALRDSVEDAVLAVRAALAEGIVPGGGLCLFLLAQQLENAAEEMPPVLAAGARLVAETMRSPLRQIAANAGEDPETVAQKVSLLNAAKPGPLAPIGFDASIGSYQDLFGAGIVDPAKVVRVALEKAASIAALMLTSSCLIYLDPAANKGQTVVQLPPMQPPQQMGQ